jgi:DNA-directed RNA polymerase specialized sigma24 family protein
MHKENNQLSNMPLEDLSEKCAQETVRYYHAKSNDPQGHDPKYCFELFRRAIQVHDEDAWHAIVTQYKLQVEKWVYGHIYFQVVTKQDDPEDLIAQVLERFWKSYTADKFARSDELKGVLKYLKMCVNGVVTDAWRKLCRQNFEQQTEDEVEDLPEARPTPENLLQVDELWQYIKKHSKNQEEYIVVYASFVLDLSPRQILADYPDLFSDIKEIYQHKANVKSRWENDTYLKGYL